MEQALLQQLQDFIKQNPEAGKWINAKADVLQCMAMEEGTTKEMFQFYLMLAYKQGQSKVFKSCFP